MKLLSHVRLFAIPWIVAHQAPPSMEFSRQEYWSGLPFPSLGFFPTQGSNPGLPHCRQTTYHLSHQVRLRSSHISLKNPNYLVLYVCTKVHNLRTAALETCPCPPGHMSHALHLDMASSGRATPSNLFGNRLQTPHVTLNPKGHTRSEC